MEIRCLTQNDLRAEKARADENMIALDENTSHKMLELYQWNLKFYYLDAVHPDIMVGVLDNNKIIGLSYISDVQDGKHLAEIIVHPDYRGKRGQRSVGKQLFETMMGVIDTLSPNATTHLEVGKDNGRAQALYTNFRYAVDSKRDHEEFNWMNREPYAHITDPEADNPYHALMLESMRVQP